MIDVAVIGAGPAGLAAATEARAQGLSVLVIDEQPRPGGQIYRAIETAPETRRVLLGPDYVQGQDLVSAFRGSGAEYAPGTLLWNAEIEVGRILLHVSTPAGSRSLSARHLVVATGALERPVPVPGWTLPGVTTAGALQILLKAHGGVAGGAVLAGSGPLLLLLARQMVDAGTPPRAVVEVGGNLRRALQHLPRAVRGWRYLAKGAAMMAALRRAGVPVYHGASGFAIEGEDEARAVRFTTRRRSHHIEADQVALHMGVVPNLQLTRMLRCEHTWDPSPQAFRPVTDDWLETSQPRVFVAGDGAGIGGATAAALRGQLVALRIAEQGGVTGPSARLQALRRELAQDATVRPFLEALYAPVEEILAPDDATIICRCEEVTAGAIRRALVDGAAGPNQLKAFLRCGMGPCQGRTCGPAVTALVARTRGIPEAQAGAFRVRPPLKPLPLSEMAQIATE